MTTYPQPKSYTCDWCGQTFFVASNPDVEEWGDPCHPGPLPWPNTRIRYQCPNAVRAKTHLITDDEGQNFCSLKCKNSYLASKDIKEKRSRKIQGE